MDFSSEFFSHLSDEDRIFVSRMYDMNDSAEKNFQPRYSFFLDDMQNLLSVSVMKHINADYILWGGFEKASRTILGIYPHYYDSMEDAKKEFPIRPLVFRYKPEYCLSHRDFLGAFMSLKISRSMIGDIVVNNGYTVAFIHENAVKVILDECCKIGSVGVKIAAEDNPELNFTESFMEISGTVSSLRLDCIVSLALKLSREKAALLIKSGNVSIRYSNIKNSQYKFISEKNELQPSFIFEEGNVFSIKGYGKFIFDVVGGRSKKDRIFITLKKYI